MKHVIFGIIISLLCFSFPNLQGKEKKSNKANVSYHSSRFAKPQKKSKTSAKSFSYPFIKVAKKVTPAVVYIQAEGAPAYDRQDPFDFFNDDFFNRFFGAPPKRRRPEQKHISQGSGFIVSPDGHILTNFHVVSGAKKITVSLPNKKGKDFSATLIGGDERTDVAMIKIDPKGHDGKFPFLEFGNSDDVEVGEWVLAIGNPFQLNATVTAGIISAKGRQNLQITDLEDFLQTDAAINPGNSGGPLIDLEGKVIGMNTAIVSRSGGYMGIGFAIPSNMLININDQLIKNGSVSRGFLGVSIQSITQDLAEALNLPDTKGALVSEVIPDSPADRVGLIQGDIITHINGNLIESPTSLRIQIMRLKPKTQVVLTINRKGKILPPIKVTLGTHGQSSFTSNAISSQMLGISVDNLTNENIKKYGLKNSDSGVVIVQVDPSSQAAKIGLQEGSLIMALNHQKIKNIRDFNKALSKIKENDKVLILVKQGTFMHFYAIKATK